MRRLLPIIPLAVAGCGSEYQPGHDVDVDVAANPRPLDNTLHTDRIVQMTQPEVDVLWVVDDSCSMYDDQEALAENFPAFFEFFDGSDLDYHLGVVTTDMISESRKGKLVSANGYRWIEPSTPAAASVFEALMPGTGGQFPEQGIDATWYALEVEHQMANLGFMREHSAVHVILISDEQDYSENLVQYGDQDPDPVTPDELSSYLNGLRADPDQVTYSSIARPDSDYVAVTQQVGGMHVSILDSDWATVLHQLGLQAAGLKREYYLSQLPVPESIEVSVADRGTTYRFTEGEDWDYDPVRNSIGFHKYVPEPMAEVLIEYEVLSSSHGD